MAADQNSADVTKAGLDTVGTGLEDWKGTQAGFGFVT